ncbi:undec1A, partial [Symbiodinium sp. KB8]
MQRAAVAAFEHAEVAIAAAAVSDYRPVDRKAGKPPRAAERIQIDLVRNPDIVAGLGSSKASGAAAPRVVVGFALESTRAGLQAAIARGREKLRHKHLDFVVVNLHDAIDATGSEVVLCFADGRDERLPRQDKSVTARRIVDKTDTDAKDQPKKRRGTKFVPLEDVPEPGLAGLENLGGAVGYYLAFAFVCPLGYAGWVPALVLLTHGVLLFIGRRVEKPIIKAVGALAFAMMFAILLAGRAGDAGFSGLTPYSAGGIFGATVSPSLEAAFGGSGRLLIVGFGMLVSLLLVTEWLFSQMLMRALAGGEELWQRVVAWWRERARPALAVEGGAVGMPEQDVADRDGDGAGRSGVRSRRGRTQTAANVDEDEAAEPDAVAEPAVTAV